MPRDSLREQFRRNLVAIISLSVALSGLAYNTWRNEKSELNSNVRTAGFEILVKVGELQRVVFLSHYDADPELGNPRLGWSHVLTIQDLSQVMPPPVPAAAEKLLQVWQRQWHTLGSSPDGVHAIDEAIDAYRGAVLASLKALR